MNRHIQLPNNMTSIKKVTPQDLLIYANIKRFMNNKTRTCFVSLAKIAENAGCCINTVRKSIKMLEKLDYIRTTKEGRKTVYYFTKSKNFEPFSYEFLDKEDLSFGEKAYLMATQQYMIKDNNKGKISYPNTILADMINLSESAIRKYNKSLIKKDYLTLLNTKTKDPESGCLVKEKMFHLTKFAQAIVFTLQNHEERITDNTEKIESLEKDNKIMMQTIMNLQKQLDELKNKDKNITLE